MLRKVLRYLVLPLAVIVAVVFGQAYVRNVELRADLPPVAGGGGGASVLIVLSAAQTLTLREGGAHPTGFFLNELSEPLAHLLAAGYAVEFASPGGRPPRVDAHSVEFLVGDARVQALALIAAQPLDSPHALEDLSEAHLERFIGVFVPGGHAPMQDLHADPALGRVLAHFHSSGKPTAALCHGPAALLSAPIVDGQWTYAGYRMTGFPRYTERALELFGVIDGHVPFYLDEALTDAGAVYTTTFPPIIPRVIRDRELVTGQDPYAAERLGAKFVHMLRLYQQLGGNVDWSAPA
ncbi:MAG TPA: type 1 glutamine amidotransferase domain-containing protein [Nannocystis sp.]|jgi:putative intracellular protease/amidase